MKIWIHNLTFLAILLTGCGRTITKNELTESITPEILLKTRDETIELLGQPYKEQSRTGGMFTLYFQDAEDTSVSVTFKDHIVVEFVVCPSSQEFTPKETDGWIMKKEKRFDQEVEAYYESSSGHTIFHKDECTYFTTNWIQKK